MKLTLSPTAQLVDLASVSHRLWQGQTERGVRVHALVAYVVALDGQHEELQRELREVESPDVLVIAIPEELRRR